jgi:streptomycin 6-kinase
VSELPSRVARAADQWRLTLDAPFPDTTASFVARAKRSDGTPCVLKVAFPEGEFFSGIEALRIWSGSGAVEMIESAPEDGALLLEFIEPGGMLADLSKQDDDAATETAAKLMARLWKDPPNDHALLDLKMWFKSLLTYRESHQGSGRFTDPLLRRAEALTTELIDSTHAPKLLHGDLHHFNVLKATREPWLCIDPKGLVGDPCFELAAFLRNPRRMSGSVLGRRLDILCRELGFDRARARDWCFAEAMLNASWDDKRADIEFEAKIAWAELVRRL